MMNYLMVLMMVLMSLLMMRMIMMMMMMVMMMMMMMMMVVVVVVLMMLMVMLPVMTTTIRQPLWQRPHRHGWRQHSGYFLLDLLASASLSSFLEYLPKMTVTIFTLYHNDTLILKKVMSLMSLRMWSWTTWATSSSSRATPAIQQVKPRKRRLIGRRRVAV